MFYNRICHWLYHKIKRILVIITLSFSAESSIRGLMYLYESREKHLHVLFPPNLLSYGWIASIWHVNKCNIPWLVLCKSLFASSEETLLCNTCTNIYTYNSFICKPFHTGKIFSSLMIWRKVVLKKDIALLKYLIKIVNIFSSEKVYSLTAGLHCYDVPTGNTAQYLLSNNCFSGWSMCRNQNWLIVNQTF